MSGAMLHVRLRTGVKAMRKINLLVVLVLTCAVNIKAQYVPVVAKIRMTHEITIPGQKAETHFQEGNFYRRSDGSILEEWTVVDGDKTRGTGGLADNKNNNIYQLNLVGRTAVFQHTPAPTGAIGIAGPPQLPDPGSSVSREVVGGLSCALSAVKASGSLQGALTGQICLSTQFNLTLKRDITSTSKSGRTDHTVYEMSEVQLYKEPDVGLFDLRARGFTILAQQSSGSSQ